MVRADTVSGRNIRELGVLAESAAGQSTDLYEFSSWDLLPSQRFVLFDTAAREALHEKALKHQKKHNHGHHVDKRERHGRSKI